MEKLSIPMKMKISSSQADTAVTGMTFGRICN